MPQSTNVIILGAAGRDFHNFNVFYRNRPEYKVVAFTAAQIPDIAGRRYPAELAGEYYPEGIPILLEEQMAQLVKGHNVTEVVFAYSDTPNQQVMEKSAIANAAGADFKLMGPRHTMLKSKLPVVSVCAVRTGCGKSQTTRAIADHLAKQGLRAAVIRHPMPYGDLRKQICEKFTSLDDLKRYECTIEEREEYELHIERGHLLFAGVDYERIMREAEKEADVILWDGGNNDMPFYEPTLHIVLADPHRPGDERTFYPSLANVLMADVLVLAKSGSATSEGKTAVLESLARLKPDTRIITADSVISVPAPEQIKGKRVLVVEDGPTLTHGGMPYGAGTIAARQFGAAELVDPRPYAVGTLAQTLKNFPHLDRALPAMGYSEAQVKDLEASIAATPCDLVLVGTPVDLARLLPRCPHPLQRVSYELDPESAAALGKLAYGCVKNRTA